MSTVVTFNNLTDSAKDRFYSAAERYVEDGKDNPFPWAAPWTWCGGEEVPPAATIEDSAREWVKQNADEILRLERERLDFMKEDGEINSPAADNLIFKIQLLGMLQAE